ncbi:sensor histidine kinase [Hoeflea alexandrii]|uniref:sensor histidine kinase n=1 Tax=Hoeflea alexandrii TaxID=288436 RepID=UPI00226EA4E6|nr:sensor histidine kinase [Hoeflea alexandrii]MCY0153027.1 sensor histidine kinase [Hoeflea alexandrii]
MRRYSISTWLTFSLFAIVAPFSLFLWFLAAQLQSSEADSVDRRTLRSAQSIARAVEPVINSMTTTVNLLASTEELANGDLKTFHRRSEFALRETGQFVIVVDEAGRQLLNTRVDYGAPLGTISDSDGFRRAMETGRPVVSNFFMGRTSRKWVFNVLKPVDVSVVSDARMLVTTMNADDLAGAMAELPLPDGWTAAIIDGDGNTLVPESPISVQMTTPDILPVDIRAEDVSSLPFISHFDGPEELVLAYAPIRGTPWNAVISGPLASAQAPILKTWKMLILGTLVLLGVCVVVIYAGTKLIRNEVRGISRMAEGVGHGRVVSPIHTRISELDLIARALSNASYDRSQKEEQLTIVTQELAHRTKNLISIVLAMVRQSSKKAKTPQDLVASTADRIAGLGQSIDLLTASEWKAITLRDLIENHVRTFGSIGGNIVLEGGEFSLGSDAVQNLGMAIHELATNASKYGALSVETGKVEISWTVQQSEADERLELRWQESGGPAVTEPEQTSFGTQILDRHLSAALNGQTEINYCPTGLVWVLNAPVATLNRTLLG